MQDQQALHALILKIRNGDDDVRRIRIDNPATTSFEDLQKILNGLFPYTDLSSVVLKYEDEEGDRLSITSSLEWVEALRPFLNREQIGTLHLTLSPRKPIEDNKPTTPAEEQNEDDDEEASDSESDDSAEITLEDISKLVTGALKAFGIDGEVIFEKPTPTAQARPFPCWFGRPPHPNPWGFPHPPPGFGGFHHPRGPAGPSCFRGPRCGSPQQQQSQQCRSQSPRCRPPVPLGETDKCTFTLTGERYAPHSQWFNCFTCGLVGVEGCCLACAGECHKGHALLPRGPSPAFFCDCGAGAKGLQCRAKAAKAEEREKGKEKEQEKEEKEEGLPASEEDLMKLKVGELKAALDARGVSYADCVDKFHLVEKIRSTNTSPAPSAPGSPIVPPAAPTEEVKNEDKNAEAEVEETPEEEQEEWEEDWEEEKEKGAEEPQPKPEEEEEEGHSQEEPKQEPSAFVQKLQFLESMGFNDRTRNIEVLIRHVGNLNGAVAELVNSDSAWSS